MAIEDGIIAAVIINLIIITMITQFLVASRRTEYFESLFPKSKYIKQNKLLYERAGSIGKMMRTGAISTILALPCFFTKRNLVDRQEIEGFPKKTKILLVTLWALHITLFSALIIAHYL